MKYKFDCGCEVEITEDKIKDYDGLPSLHIDYENLNLNCPKVWNLYASGKTRGVFQLETQLGAGWSKKLEPESTHEIAALLSILRPGCLKSSLDGKSMTQHYVDRKHGEQYKDIDQSISDIMCETHGILVYQEQSMKIAQRIAGFDLKQSDNLRKGIGKKRADILAAIREEFVNGCLSTGIVTEEIASTVYDIIEKSNRYSFNASHAYGYGIISYWTAWVKSHFPLHFFCSVLSLAKDDDIGDFIDDAKDFDIKVLPPSIIIGNTDYKIVDKKIVCGLSNIKGVGQSTVISAFEKVKQIQTECGKELKNFSWIECLIYLDSCFSKTVFINLIAAGAFSHLNIYRKKMMFDYNQLSLLTGKNEIPWLKSNISRYNTLDDGIELMLNENSTSKAISSTRVKKVQEVLSSLRNRNFTTVDDESWVASVEEELIGSSISCSRLDSCDTSCGDTTCDDFNKKQPENTVNIACQVYRVSEYIPKNGEKMLYVTIKDSTANCEAVVYSNNVPKIESLLYKGNTICITGKRNNRGNLTIYDAIQI
jgi:DNA polymerase-3 subunit alpha